MAIIANFYSPPADSPTVLRRPAMFLVASLLSHLRPTSAVPRLVPPQAQDQAHLCTLEAHPTCRPPNRLTRMMRRLSLPLPPRCLYRLPQISTTLRAVALNRPKSRGRCLRRVSAMWPRERPWRVVRPHPLLTARPLTLTLRRLRLRKCVSVLTRRLSARWLSLKFPKCGKCELEDARPRQRSLRPSSSLRMRIYRYTAPPRWKTDKLCLGMRPPYAYPYFSPYVPF